MALGIASLKRNYEGSSFVRSRILSYDTHKDSLFKQNIIAQPLRLKLVYDKSYSRLLLTSGQFYQQIFLENFTPTRISKVFFEKK